MRALARWCYRHRRLVLLGWILALLVLGGLSRSIGTSFSDQFTLPDTDSTRAIKLVEQVSKAQSGDTEQVVFATSNGAKLQDAAVKARVTKALAGIQRFPHVSTIRSPYAAPTVQISKDGTIGYAAVVFDVQAQDLGMSQAKDFVKQARAGGGSGLQIEVSGFLASNADQQSPGGGVGIGIIAAAIVLFLVFGSLLAMFLPLITALLALGTATSLVGLLTHVMSFPTLSTELMLLVGLGVGVDYALFIVTRHRQGLVAGKDPESALVTAIDTSGRAVLFAGITVCIALLGMFALGVSFLYGLAVSTAIGVLFVMAASLTLLPALLGFLGPKVLSRRQRRRVQSGEFDDGSGQTRWRRWAELVDRRPALIGGIALLVMVAIALPFFSLRLGSSDSGNDPTNTTTRKSYDLLAKGFGPGSVGPLQLTSELKAAGDSDVVNRLAAAARTQPDVAQVSPPVIIAGSGRRIAVVNVIPKSAPQDEATTKLVDRFRHDVVPSITRGTDVKTYVGGNTAIFEDFAGVLSNKLPLFIGIVVLLSYILLTLLFRSLVVPLVAALMNLLSVGAAFGVLVAVFQWGWGLSALGVSRTGPIEAFLPVMLFAILFGLSTDYEVFLVSRIHEEWLKRGDNRAAVVNGLAETGKTITAAAAIMFLVFAAFILGGQRPIKEFGLGFAAAIALDALIVRTALVPSITLMLGTRNWWLPGWLDRTLPRVAVEPDTPDESPDDRADRPVSVS